MSLEDRLSLRQLVDKMRHRAYNTTEIMQLINSKRWPVLRRMKRLIDKEIVIKRRIGRNCYYLAVRPYVVSLRRTPKFKSREDQIDRLSRQFGITREEFLRQAEQERQVRQAAALPKRVKLPVADISPTNKEVKRMPISLEEWEAGKDATTVPLEQIMQPSLAYSTAEVATALSTSVAAARARLLRAEKDGRVQHKKIKGRVVWALVGK